MDSLPVNAADLTVLAILGLSGLLSFLRGFVKEFASFLSWFGGVFTAYVYLFEGIETLSWEHLSKTTLTEAGIALLLLVGVTVALSLLGRAVVARIPTERFSALDRSLGLLYGIARGAFVVCVFYIVVTMFVVRDEFPDWMRKARSLPLIERGAKLVEMALPAVAQQAERAEEASGDLMEKLRKGRRDKAPELGDEAPELSGE